MVSSFKNRLRILKNPKQFVRLILHKSYIKILFTYYKPSVLPSRILKYGRLLFGVLCITEIKEGMSQNNVTLARKWERERVSVSRTHLVRIRSIAKKGEGP